MRKYLPNLQETLLLLQKSSTAQVVLFGREYYHETLSTIPPPPLHNSKFLYSIHLYISYTILSLGSNHKLELWAPLCIVHYHHRIYCHISWLLSLMIVLISEQLEHWNIKHLWFLQYISFNKNWKNTGWQKIQLCLKHYYYVFQFYIILTKIVKGEELCFRWQALYHKETII